MSFVEVVGLLASLIGVIYLFTKDTLDKRQKAKDPVKYAEKERHLKAVLQSMGVPVEEDEENDEPEEEDIYTPPPQPKPKLVPKNNPAAIKTKPIQLPPRKSHLSQMISQLPDKRAILVSHILFGPPKSLE